MNMFIAFAAPLLLIASLAGGQSSNNGPSVSGRITSAQVAESAEEAKDRQWLQEASKQCNDQVKLTMPTVFADAAGGEVVAQGAVALVHTECMHPFREKLKPKATPVSSDRMTKK